MDTTEQRAGFRLPWSDRRDPPADDAGGGPPVDADPTDMPQGAEMPAPEGEMHAPDAEMQALVGGAMEGEIPAEAAVAHGAGPVRRQSKFLAELTRAMHTAAEEGRVATLDQLRADGKAAVEEIQSRSADDATAIRRRADDDVTHIREWSKAEIARIREETEQRIAARKTELDHELEGHAAVIEAEIESVQGQVTAFESEMDAFFERLIAEQDPGRFAALAASLPEPTPFAPLTEAQRAEIVARATAPTEVLDESPESGPAEVQPEAAQPVGDDMMSGADGVADSGSAPQEMPEDGAVETVGETEQAASVEQGGEWPADAETQASGEMDPGAAAPPDFADAERDALAGASAEEADGAAVADGSISARLAGLAAPAHQATPEAPSQDGPVETSQVVVTGLTSVSSIAAFKRQLGRLDGVRSVAVSSGPSGEFVFAVSHRTDVVLADGVASLGGFAPQIERTEPGLVEVTARDPEA
jgi:hypothetical protein